MNRTEKKTNNETPLDASQNLLISSERFTFQVVTHSDLTQLNLAQRKVLSIQCLTCTAWGCRKLWGLKGSGCQLAALTKRSWGRKGAYFIQRFPNPQRIQMSSTDVFISRAKLKPWQLFFWLQLYALQEVKTLCIPSWARCLDIVDLNISPSRNHGFKTLGCIQPCSDADEHSQPPTSKLLSSESLNSGQELFKSFTFLEQCLWWSVHHLRLF